MTNVLGINQGIVNNHKTQGNSPDTPSLVYCAMRPRLDMINAVYGGTETMRKAGEIYTPKFTVESDENYKLRVAKTTLTNILKEAVYGVASRPFSKPMVLKFTDSDDSDPDERIRQVVLKAWMKDIDLEGNDLHNFFRTTMRKAAKSGLCYVFADYPDIGRQDLSILEETKLGIRPYLIRIEAENMLQVIYEVMDGYKVAVYARWKDTEVVKEGKFGERRINVVHEVKAASFDEKEKRTQATWTTYKQLNQTWSEDTKVVDIGIALPLEKITIGDSENVDEVVPYFLDLAYKNVEHWNSSSDQRNILTHTRFPQRVFKGIEPPYKKDANGKLLRDADGNPELISVPSGPDQVYHIKDANGDAGYMQAPMGGVSAGEKDLENLVDTMREMSLAPIVSSAGITATAEVKSESRANSLLLEWTLDTKRVAERAITHMCAWAELRIGGFEIGLNTSFGISKKDLDELSRFDDMRRSGDMTRRAYLREVIARIPLHDDYQINEEIEELAEQDFI